MALRGLKFYTVKEVSELMQVRIETVLRWIYSKKIKASKLPGSRVWRIREEDIEAFMELGSNMTGNIDKSELDDILNNDVEDIKMVKERAKTVAENVKSNIQTVQERKEINTPHKNHNAFTKNKGEEMSFKAEKEVQETEFITVGKPIQYRQEDVVKSFTFD